MLLLQFQKLEEEGGVPVDEMDDFRNQCGLRSLSEGDNNQKFCAAVSAVIFNTLNLNKKSCEYCNLLLLKYMHIHKNFLFTYRFE